MRHPPGRLNKRQAVVVADGRSVTFSHGYNGRGGLRRFWQLSPDQSAKEVYGTFLLHDFWWDAGAAKFIQAIYVVFQPVGLEGPAAPNA